MGVDAACVCVVDAYSTGNLYAVELRKRGLRSLHVHSDPSHVQAFSAAFRPDDHAVSYTFDGDFDRLVREVRAHRPLCVIAGFESGVLLADRLSEALGLPTNGTALSRARREKYAMQQQIQAAGLRGIPSLLTRDWPTAEAWIRGRYPVVLKPPASAGTQLVQTCATRDQAHEAFVAILSKHNMFDEKNEDVLIQPFIEGDEYILNTVSCAGHHVLMSVWKVQKVRGRHTLYDHVELQPYESMTALCDYAFAVLDALGIRYGAGHTEVFVTREGPCFIEMGARMGGQKGTVLVERATGRNTVDASIDGYIAPERFFERYSTPYQLNLHASRVELISPRAGTLVAMPRLDEIRALASYDEAFPPKLGAPIKKTTDFLTIPGFVDLLHADPAVIARDRAKIRELEASGLYEIIE